MIDFKFVDCKIMSEIKHVPYHHWRSC